MSEAAEIVARGYDTAASAYAPLEAVDQPWPRMRWLDVLLERLSDGCRVLDLGCASAVPVTARVAQRHQVTGVDVSPIQIERPRQNVPEGTFRCEDILKVDFPDNHFDAVLSFYTIDHIPREHHDLLFTRIHRWLREGGLLLLSVEDDDQPEAIAEWLGGPMYFSHYDASTTERLVSGAGFTVERSEVELQWEGKDEIPYLFLLARKPVQG